MCRRSRVASCEHVNIGSWAQPSFPQVLDTLRDPLRHADAAAGLPALATTGAQLAQRHSGLGLCSTERHAVAVAAYWAGPTCFPLPALSSRPSLIHYIPLRVPWTAPANWPLPWRPFERPQCLYKLQASRPPRRTPAWRQRQPFHLKTTPQTLQAGRSTMQSLSDQPAPTTCPRANCPSLGPAREALHDTVPGFTAMNNFNHCAMMPD